MAMLRRALQQMRGQSPPEPRGVALSSDGIWEVFGIRRTHAGARVNQHTALNVSAVYAAVTLIAGTIGSLPVHVYRLRDDGSREQIRTPGTRVLWGRPNPAMTRQVFWETVTGCLLLWGNAYLYKGRDGTGRVTHLWPMNPAQVSVDGIHPQTFEKRFRVVDAHGTPTLMSQQEIIHIPLFSLDGLTGLSPIALAREGIGLAMATEEFGSRFFGQGSHLGGVIEVPAGLDDAEARRLAKAFAVKHSGMEHAHIPAILDGGAKWREIGIPPEDAQFLQTRAFQVEEIARWYRVPPHLIGHTEKVTSWGAGIAEQNLSLHRYTLLPVITRFEQAVSDDPDLLPETTYARFVVDGFLRGDTKSRYEAYKMAIEGGWVSPNEVRALEDEDPFAGGDLYRMPANYAVLTPDGPVMATPAPPRITLPPVEEDPNDNA